MTNIEFERAVHRGLGRAVLWLSSGDVRPDRDFILHACTHNLAYDRQTEDNRARYLFDMIHATGEPEFYARAVESALADVSDNEDDLENESRSISQMFDLLGLLAKIGDLSARCSVYSFYEQHSAGPSGSREEVLIDSDGLEGYLFVVRQWLQYPRQADDHWYEAYLLEQVEKRFGATEVHAFLEQASQSEPAVRGYIAEVREKQDAWHAWLKQISPRPQPTYAGIRRLILDPKKRFAHTVLERSGKNLTDSDAMRLAQDLLAETDLGHLERYLFSFKRRPFPLDHTPLLALARGPDQKVATAARAALSQVTHPSVRLLAMELIETSPSPWELIALLILNAQPGDELVIECVLNQPWDAEEMHLIGCKILSVFERNLTPAARPSLLLFYEEGFCTMCRHGTIELLMQLGPLPPHLIDECRYDAYELTRELVQVINATSEEQREPKREPTGEDAQTAVGRADATR